jgi:hypothetical protein
MQFFKGDDREKQFYESGKVIMDDLSAAKDDFLAGAYSAAPLGDLLWDDMRAPLSRAIKKAIFRDAFTAIFDAFVVAGTFESYLTVFREIFGSDVEVTFTVPAAGKLNIDIVSTDLVLYDFVARNIVDEAYVFDNVVYYDGDGTDDIEFRAVKGFQSQYELEQMLFELVPGGIFTTISLTLGG